MFPRLQASVEPAAATPRGRGRQSEDQEWQGNRVQGLSSLQQRCSGFFVGFFMLLGKIYYVWISNCQIFRKPPT